MIFNFDITICRYKIDRQADKLTNKLEIQNGKCVH